MRHKFQSILILILLFLTFYSCKKVKSDNSLSSQNIEQEMKNILSPYKVWGTYYNDGAEGGKIFTKFNKFCGDTTIHSIVFKKVWETTDTNLVNWQEVGCIRVNNNIVYYKDLSSDVETEIYDFNLKIGDSVKNQSQNLMIVSIDSIKIQDIYLKRYQLQQGNDSEREIWIEGLGSNFGILNSKRLGVTGGTTTLLSVKLNNELIY